MEARLDVVATVVLVERSPGIERLDYIFETAQLMQHSNIIGTSTMGGEALVWRVLQMPLRRSIRGPKLVVSTLLRYQDDCTFLNWVASLAWSNFFFGNSL